MIPLKVKLTKINDIAIDFQIIQQDEALRRHRDIFTSTNNITFHSAVCPAIHSAWDIKRNIYLRGSSINDDYATDRQAFSSPFDLATFVLDLTLAVNELNAYIADKEHL